MPVLIKVTRDPLYLALEISAINTGAMAEDIPIADPTIILPIRITRTHVEFHQVQVLKNNLLQQELQRR